MAVLKGLEFSSSHRRFCGDVVSPWVTEHWANHGATREHYQHLRSVFSASCPTTTESTELGWNTCILELPYSRKQKKTPCLYTALLTQCFFTLFANWYVISINAKITCKTGNNKNIDRFLSLAKQVGLCTCPEWCVTTGYDWGARNLVVSINHMIMKK
jgi:hypothetical protein